MIYDYIVIGSGFGGSVASLRLAGKGYSVLVIEQGKLYTAEINKNADNCYVAPLSALYKV